MAETWKRPASVPYPTTWDVFDGLKPLPNGQVPRFRIQDTTDDLAEETIQQMISYFLFDEPYCGILGLGDDKEIVEEMRDLWRGVLKHHVGLVAILENADELEDKTLPKIAGCNMTYPIFPTDKDLIVKSAKLKSIVDMMKIISKKVNCFEKYNTSVIMYAFGLSVHPVFRGQDIGRRLLKARFPLGKALGIPATTSVFTALAAKNVAKKVGFEVLAEMNSEDYKEDGVEIFKGVEPKLIQFSGTKIE